MSNKYVVVRSLKAYPDVVAERVLIPNRAVGFFTTPEDYEKLVKAAEAGGLMFLEGAPPARIPVTDVPAAPATQSEVAETSAPQPEVEVKEASAEIAETPVEVKEESTVKGKKRK